MGNVYVTYRRSDVSLVRHLADHLSQRLHSLDNVSVSGNDTTNRAWETQIRLCDALVVLVTPNTFERTAIDQLDDPIRNELKLALKLHKPVALAIVDHTMLPAQLPIDIQDVKSKLSVPIQSAFPEVSFDKLAQQVVSIGRARIALRESAAPATIPTSMSFSQLTHTTLEPPVSYTAYMAKWQTKQQPASHPNWLWLIVTCLALIGAVLLVSGSPAGVLLLVVGVLVFIWSLRQTGTAKLS